MPNNDDWTDPNSPTPSPVKKKGMSGCMFATLILGGLGAVGMLLCCGGGIWFASMFTPVIANTPAEVEAVAKKILNTQVMPDFTPTESVTMDNMMFTMRIAEFKHKEGKGDLMMGSMKLKIGDPNQAKMQQRQFRDPFEQKVFNNILVKSSETVEVALNGQNVPVTISKGTNQQTNREVYKVTADFEQAGSPTFIIMTLDDDVWDQDSVLKMIEDAKPPEGN